MWQLIWAATFLQSSFWQQSEETTFLYQDSPCGRTPTGTRHQRTDNRQAQKQTYKHLYTHSNKSMHAHTHKHTHPHTHARTHHDDNNSSMLAALSRGWRRKQTGYKKHAAVTADYKCKQMDFYSGRVLATIKSAGGALNACAAMTYNWVPWRFSAVRCSPTIELAIWYIGYLVVCRQSATSQFTHHLCNRMNFNTQTSSWEKHQEKK